MLTLTGPIPILISFPNFLWPLPTSISFLIGQQLPVRSNIVYNSDYFSSTHFFVKLRQFLCVRESQLSGVCAMRRGGGIALWWPCVQLQPRVVHDPIKKFQHTKVLRCISTTADTHTRSNLNLMHFLTYLTGIQNFTQQHRSWVSSVFGGTE